MATSTGSHATADSRNLSVLNIVPTSSYAKLLTIDELRAHGKTKASEFTRGTARLDSD